MTESTIEQRASFRIACQADEQEAGLELNGKFVPATLLNYSTSGLSFAIEGPKVISVDSDIRIATFHGQFIVSVRRCLKNNRQTVVGAKIISEVETRKQQTNCTHLMSQSKHIVGGGTGIGVVLIVFALWVAIFGVWKFDSILEWLGDLPLPF